MIIDFYLKWYQEEKVPTDTRVGQLKPLKEEVQHDTSREAISKKHSGTRDHLKKQASGTKPTQKDSTSLTVDAGNSDCVRAPASSGGLASKWESMKSGLLNFKSNLEANRFLLLHQTQENMISSHASSSESLDEIFERLKQPTLDHRDYGAKQ